MGKIGGESQDPTMSSTAGIGGSDHASASQEQVYLSGEFLPATFRLQSLELARDIVHYVCRHESAFPAPTKSALIMRNLIDDTLKSRLDMMHELVKKLDVKRREQLELLDSIATNMFDDQMVNWGRIVTLHAFCGYLARYCEERHIPDCADDIAHMLANIVVNRLGLWIVVNGGWGAFEQQFPTVCMFETSGFWKAVILLALMVGAVLAFYSSFRYSAGDK